MSPSADKIMRKIVDAKIAALKLGEEDLPVQGDLWGNIDFHTEADYVVLLDVPEHEAGTLRFAITDPTGAVKLSSVAINEPWYRDTKYFLVGRSCQD